MPAGACLTERTCLRRRNTATVAHQLAASFALALRFDFAKLRLIVPVRLSLAVVIPLVIGLLIDHLVLGVAAAIGAFMCGVADSGDAFPVRARAMLTTAVLLMAMTMIGGAVSENVPLTIALAGVLALLCGYAGVLGPNAGLTGQLALVMYTMYAGNPVFEDAVVAQGLAAFAGALLQTGFALASWPFKRCAGIRGRIADTWRTFAVRASGNPQGLLSASLPGEIVYAATQIRVSETYGETRRWLQDLLTAAERMRFPLASIATQRVLLMENNPEAEELADLDNFCAAVSRFSRGVARALVLTRRRKHVAAELVALRTAAAKARRWAPKQVDAVTDACETAAELMTAPYPIGRRATFRYRLNFGPPDWRELIRHDLYWQSPILRHAIRLAIITLIAWVLGELLFDEHQYWIALTVVWVTKPGYGLTMGRVVSRTSGTLVGLALVGSIFLIFAPGHWGMVVIVGLAAYVMYAALPVNYAFAVIFISTLVVTLLELDGDALLGSLEYRALETVIGGLLALASSFVGASWAAPKLVGALGRVTTSLSRYVTATVEQDGDFRAATEELINARREASEVIEAAALEPKKGVLPPARAERVLSAMLISSFIVAGTDPESQSKEVGHDIDIPALKADLAELADRLSAIDDGRVKASTGPVTGVPISSPEFGEQYDPARQAVHRAIGYL